MSEGSKQQSCPPESKWAVSQKIRDQDNAPYLARSVGHSTDNSCRWKYPTLKLVHSDSGQYTDQQFSFQCLLDPRLGKKGISDLWFTTGEKRSQLRDEPTKECRTIIIQHLHFLQVRHCLKQRPRQHHQVVQGRQGFF